MRVSLIAILLLILLQFSQVSGNRSTKVSQTSTVANINIDATPGVAINSFSPLEALGADVDSQPARAIQQIYNQKNIAEMLSAGHGALAYRISTELAVQYWHWNPTGKWSDPARRGYWTGSTNLGSPITLSYGYRLDHRGNSTDTANNDNYSRLVDGNITSYWKSNPYLSSYFTNEDDALHPQWVVVDLGSQQAVNAIKLTWSKPYATSYQVQYWNGQDAIYDQSHGSWVTFQYGTVTGAKGGTKIIKLSDSPINAEYVRVLMTASSGDCDTHGSADIRNCLGYALAEIGVGKLKGTLFMDLVHHSINGQLQTLAYASSVDPWHSISDIYNTQAQAGLDLVFNSGLTRNLPALVPVGMLYGTPDDAAAEVAYLEARGYKLSYVELGEEPDGQFILPEDYGALYLRWADALHAVDPSLKLGGPVFQGTNQDVQVWADANGNTSWLSRFINYLNAHNRLSDLSFMSFEHYPFNCSDGWTMLLDEPTVVQNIINAWHNDGLPANVPILVTEYNFSANATAVFQEVLGAVWQADFIGSFLNAGGAGAFYYEYEPTPPAGSSSQCSGSFGMFSADDNNQIQYPTAQFYSSQLINQEWAQPIDAAHSLLSTTSDAFDLNGNLLITAYTLLRPDGQYSLLLINKDQAHTQNVQITFHNSSDGIDRYFNGSISMICFGVDNYNWHINGGFANPNNPPKHTVVNGAQGTIYSLPRGSITILRGNIQ
jgi:hypothetical protein